MAAGPANAGLEGASITSARARWVLSLAGIKRLNFFNMHALKTACARSGCVKFGLADFWLG